MAIPGVFQCLLVSALLAGFAHGMSLLTTTPEYPNPPKCEYDGQTKEPGEFQPDPCTFCTCEDDGLVTCYVMDCAMPTCENPIKEPDECCGWCPEEPTSSTTPYGACDYDGETYQPGEFQPDPCTFCTCEDDGTVTCYMMACEMPACENPIKEPDECCGWCPEEPTSSTPPYGACDYDGEIYQPGESFNPDVCTFCNCDPDGSGQHYCAIADCFGPQCVDAIYDPTQCCPLCPNGPNCQHGDTVIPRGETVSFETGETCMCDAMIPWNLEAVCMMTWSTTNLPPPPPPSPSPTPLETLPPSQPPTATIPLSPREARRLEKEAQRQARQEAREERKEKREARKAARKAQRAERRAKRSSES